MICRVPIRTPVAYSTASAASVNEPRTDSWAHSLARPGEYRPAGRSSTSSSGCTFAASGAR